MDFRSFMVQEIDDEFKFLPEGCIYDNQCSPYPKFVNNEAPVIDANPLTSVHPSDFVKDVVDSDDASAGHNENPRVGTSLLHLPEAGKKLRSLGKRKLPFGVGDSLLKVQKWLPKQARTRKLIFALHKATASCDAIRAWELEKDISYAELERKCNESLLDLDKNPLVADMQTEIKTLQGRVDGLHSKCTRLDMALVIAKVVPNATTKLIHSEEMGMLVVKLVKASIIYGRCAAFEEVAKLKEPFVMEKMAGYHPSSKQEYD
uniref:Uncharacterized protein n=1 Tax=Tanacetum cinerariifolium TaxID=118510 RepID=A0A6L2JQ80_TANCI|nr:hypothetical protein [Tanacetum cinerariifolium]